MRDSNTGITVILTTGAWDGSPADLEREFTVVHALVANMGRAAIRLAPGDLELRDERGFHYELLDAGGSFRRARPGETSGLQGRPESEPYPTGADDDYEYIEASGTDIAASALPWGYLEPGTQMRGFLYFEELDTAHAAKLVWHFFDANGGQLVDLRFDFALAT
ncbi:MAG: hypothetical protein KC636_37465 [Myxococcales bacterium]|nr:hypothetical protein [Myxococcales bacterium]